MTDVTVKSFEVLQGQLHTKDEQIKARDEQLLIFAKALLGMGIDPNKAKDLEGEVARLKRDIEEKEKQIAWLAREPIGLSPARTSYIFTFAKNTDSRIIFNENQRVASCTRAGNSYVSLVSAAPIPPGSARSVFSVRFTRSDAARHGILIGLVPKLPGQDSLDLSTGFSLHTGDGVSRTESGAVTATVPASWKGAWSFNKTGMDALVMPGGLVEFDIDLNHNLVYITIINGDRVVTSTVVGHFQKPMPAGVDLYPVVGLGYDGQQAQFE
jgi:hypothetical protein